MGNTCSCVPVAACSRLSSSRVHSVARDGADKGSRDVAAEASTEIIEELDEDASENIDFEEAGGEAWAALVVHGFKETNIFHSIKGSLGVRVWSSNAQLKQSAKLSDEDDEDDDDDLSVPYVAIIVIGESLLHDLYALRYLCAVHESDKCTPIVLRVNGESQGLTDDLEGLETKVGTDILGMLDSLGITVHELRDSFSSLARARTVTCSIEDRRVQNLQERLLRSYVNTILHMHQREDNEEAAQVRNGLSVAASDTGGDDAESAIEAQAPDVILFHTREATKERGLVPLLEDELKNRLVASWLYEEEDSDDDDSDEDDEEDADDSEEEVDEEDDEDDQPYLPETRPGSAQNARSRRTVSGRPKNTRSSVNFRKIGNPDASKERHHSVRHVMPKGKQVVLVTLSDEILDEPETLRALIEHLEWRPRRVLPAVIFVKGPNDHVTAQEFVKRLPPDVGLKETRRHLQRSHVATFDPRLAHRKASVAMLADLVEDRLFQPKTIFQRLRASVRGVSRNPR